MTDLVFNPAPLVTKLGTLAARLADLKPVYEDIGEYAVGATKRRFLTGTAPDGSRWRAKRPATIARYKAQGDGAKTRPLIGPSGRLGREVTHNASSAGVEIGSALEYSRVMQEGAERGAFGADKAGHPLPWGTIPARVWLGLSDTDNRNILDIVDEHLGELVDE